MSTVTTNIYWGIQNGLLEISDQPTSIATTLDTRVYNPSSLTEDIPWYTSRANITEVRVVGNVVPLNINYWFYDCYNLTQASFNGLDTSNVTNMLSVFYGCSSLVSLDLSNLKTGNVTEMGSMFYGCVNLTSLLLRHWDTRKLVVSESMFGNCSSLTELNLGYFKTDSLDWTSDMFRGCTNLTTIKVSSNWDISHLQLEYTKRMFEGCTSLVGENGTTYDSTHTNKDYARIDVSGSPGYLTSCITKNIYWGVRSGVLEISNTPTSIATTLSTTVYNSSSSTTIPWLNNYIDKGLVSTIRVVGDVAPISLCNWFRAGAHGGNTNVTTVDLEGLNTSEVTNMTCLFINQSKLTSLDISNFDTSKVTDMQLMFSWCTNLTSLDLSNFDTSNVTSMRSMFSYTDLSSLDLSNFDTSNVTDMYSMFAQCPSLQSIDVSNFDTGNVTNMQYMFWGTAITSIDVSNFDTSSVTNMSYMFYLCKSLISLDLSNFDTSNVTDMSYMFLGCTSLTTIYVSELWSIKNVTSSTKMFSNCTAIVGQNGTTYDSSYIDASYAHIDVPGNPGYLSFNGPIPPITTRPVYFNGTQLTDVYYNGTKLDHLYFNNNQLF